MAKKRKRIWPKGREIICPCCILPSASCFWDRKSFGGWLEHLEQLAQETHEIRRETLPIDGRNVVLVGTPR